MTRNPFSHLLIALALFALAVLGYLLWYFHIKGASERAALLLTDVARKEADAERLQAVSSALSELSEDEQSVRQYFVSAEDVVSFLEYLESAGNALGAVVEVVSVSPEAAGARERLAISMRITGSFDAVVRTLGRIEYGPYDIQVGTMTLDTAISDWTAATVLSVGMNSAP